MTGNTVTGAAALPLGTAEAAVRSCVSVLAAVTAQREDMLAYWLDLYYQVRRAYEREQEHEADPRLIRREDLYPVMRELMRDAMKSTAREEAKRRAAGKDDPPPAAPEPPFQKGAEGRRRAIPKSPLQDAEDGKASPTGSAGAPFRQGGREEGDDGEEKIASPARTGKEDDGAAMTAPP